MAATLNRQRASGSGAQGGGGGYVIENALRFNSADSATLNWTPSGAGDSTTDFTISMWFKRGTMAAQRTLFDANGTYESLTFEPSDKLQHSTAAVNRLRTTQLFRDPTAWMHVVLRMDLDNGTAGDKNRLYINGVEVTAFDVDSTAGTSFTKLNTAVAHHIGSQSGTTNFFDGYIAECIGIDGASLGPDSFGEYDSNANWVPIEYGSTASALTVNYITSSVTGTNATDYSGSFDGISIGTASADRRVVVAASGARTSAGKRTVSSMTIGGVTAQQDSITGPSAQADGNDIWSAVVPTGSTADIDIVWSAAMLNMGINVWTVTGGVSTRVAVHDTLEVGHASAALSGTITVPTDGVLIANAYGDGTLRTWSWTNATERSDESLESTASHSGADASVAGDITITATPNGAYTSLLSTVSYAAPGTHEYDFGTNGFHLDFAVAPGTAYGAGTDVSKGPGFIHRGEGTAIGNLTVHGGLAGGFNGVYNETTAGAALGAGTGYIGKTWASAKTITGFYIESYSNKGFVEGATPEITCNVYGKSGSAPSSSTDGTSLFEQTKTDGNNTLLTFESASITQTSYDHIWVRITSSGANVHVGEVEFYENNATIGRRNHFTESGLAANDQVSDSPTDSADDNIGNYCVGNSVFGLASAVYANGNLDIDMDDDSAWGTIYASGGKYYYEMDLFAGDTNGVVLGISEDTGFKHAKGGSYAGSGGHADNADAYAFYATSGTAKKVDQSGTTTTYGDAVTIVQNTILQCAVDFDNGLIWFGFNDTWIDGTGGAASSSTVKTDIEAGNSTYAAFTGISGSFAPWFFCANANAVRLNFGANAFDHTPPTGFVPWNTAALPAPAVKDPTKHFQVDTFTGTAGELARTLTDRSDAAFAPDLIWGTNRTNTGAVHMVDSVRGATKEIESDDYSDEATAAQGVKSFDASGYTLGTDADYNAASANVNWCFKLGGAPTGDNSAGAAATPTAGSVKVDGANHGSAATGSIPVLRGSANTTAAMSAIKWTGTGANGTIDHFLGVAPNFIAVKTLANGSGGNSWRCYHSGVASDAQDYALQLNGLIAAANDSIFWNDTAPTSSVFSVGSSAEVHTNGNPSIAYCFASVDNYSKIGSFEGNGNANGSYVHLGFRPAFILVKSADSTSEWDVYDSKRDGYNPDNDALSISTPLAETTANDIDILSDGFKCRIATDPNVAETYVYMAIADHPSGEGVSQARAR